MHVGTGGDLGVASRRGWRAHHVVLLRPLVRVCITKIWCVCVQGGCQCVCVCVCVCVYVYVWVGVPVYLCTYFR